MRNLSRREKILLFIAAVIVVVGGYYYFLYIPLQEEQENMQSEITDLQEQIRLDRERIEQIPELEEELAQLKEERDTILEVGYRDPEEIVATLNSFSQETGLEILSYNKGEAEGGYPFELSVNGPYFSLLQFINMVDEWDYRLGIEDFMLNAIEDEDRPGRRVIELDLNFFFHHWEDVEEFFPEEN